MMLSFSFSFLWIFYGLRFSILLVYLLDSSHGRHDLVLHSLDALLFSSLYLKLGVWWLESEAFCAFF